MEILFKVTNTGGNAATVGHSNFKQHYSAINDNLSWDTLKPSIRKATIEHLIPHISQEIYDALVDYYHNGDTQNTEEEEFLEACQDAVAYYTMIYAAPELNVSASDMGMVEKGSTSAPVLPVAQWRYKEFKYDLCKKADKMLDRVIALLEKYTHSEVEFFEGWVDTTAYVETRTNFFQSATEFSKYVKINNSRRLFQQIMQDILRVEEEIDKIICETQFNALVTAIKEGDLDESETALVEQIRRYIAPKALAMAAPLMYLTLDSNGLYLSSYTDGYDSHNHLSQASRGAEAVGNFVLKLKTDAEFQHHVLMNFIHSHIDDYPDIEDSDCYAMYTQSRVGPVDVGPGGIML